ncbi:hypothetical protein Vafri_14307 [Volvox africanus]|uniref:Uncharacterized protein n=1 Tax=Volvox africanus TaxID=51714 RepID=A0A8J4BDX9_9CHLO|nr:hypothetical protein Vafri_14307 [Volvox africanus]
MHLPSKLAATCPRLRCAALGKIFALAAGAVCAGNISILAALIPAPQHSGQTHVPAGILVMAGFTQCMCQPVPQLSHSSITSSWSGKPHTSQARSAAGTASRASVTGSTSGRWHGLRFVTFSFRSVPQRPLSVATPAGVTSTTHGTFSRVGTCSVFVRLRSTT